MDRFLMRISIGYPGRQAERELLKRPASREALNDVSCCIGPADVERIQSAVDRVHASDALLEYLQDIIDFTRKEPLFMNGLSPRAGLSLLQASRAWAFIDGRDHVLPEDIQQVLPWVVSHRLRSAKNYSEIPVQQLLEIFKIVSIP
ncbi:MAG: MoxR family ATPase [Pseudomonadota bacterium]